MGQQCSDLCFRNCIGALQNKKERNIAQWVVRWCDVVKEIYTAVCVVQDYNLSTGEAEAGLHEFEVSLSCIGHSRTSRPA